MIFVDALPALKNAKSHLTIHGTSLRKQQYILSILIKGLEI